MNEQLPESPAHPWRHLAIVPIPVAILAIVVLWIADVRVTWTQPFVYSLVHFGTAALGVAFILIPAASSFLATGQPSVMMLGCGVFMSMTGALAAGIGFQRGLDTGFAIYNTSVLLSALCHFTGVVVTSRRKLRMTHTAAWLIAATVGAMAAMGLVVWGAFAGRMPAFFIDGQGGTLLRTLVVSGAAALFLLTAVLLWQTNRRAAAPFLYWYALGLVLLAAGLTGSMAIAVQDSPLQWVTRYTQVCGTIYMCVAVLRAERHSGAPVVPMTAVEEAWQADVLLTSLRRHTLLRWIVRYGLAVLAVTLAFDLRLALTAWVGPGLPTYITFYPAIMAVALFAGLGPALLATALADLATAIWILPPLGQLAAVSPADRLGLAIFAIMGIFMGVVAELYRRRRHKAAAYDRDAALREGEDRFIKNNQGGRDFCFFQV